MNFFSLLEGEDRKNAIQKSGSSNLVVDRTKSVVKLVIFVFFCEKLVLSKKLWSILTKLLTSVRRSLLGKEQWRKKNE